MQGVAFYGMKRKKIGSCLQAVQKQNDHVRVQNCRAGALQKIVTSGHAGVILNNVSKRLLFWASSLDSCRGMI